MIWNNQIIVDEPKINVDFKIMIIPTGIQLSNWGIFIGIAGIEIRVLITTLPQKPYGIEQDIQGNNNNVSLFGM